MSNTQNNINKFTKSICSLVFLLLASSVLAKSTTDIESLDQQLEAHVNAAVQRSLDGFNVPGLLIAVVHKGETVLAKGYGKRQFDQKASVDEETLFQIASVSKAFTAAGLALLVDEGKLGWDDHVIDYLPEFRMYDPWVTREFTIRDLLTHRSGLPLGAGDLLFVPPGDTDVDDVIKALGYLKPSSSFRSKYDYDNLMYVVAGEVLSRVSGMSYADFVEQRIFEPLKVQGCFGDVTKAAGQKNLATPHLIVEEELQTTKLDFQEFMAAAGGVTCNAKGMAAWMKMWLNDGAAPDGTQLISEQQMTQLRKPVTLTSTSPLLAEHADSFMTAYALGWGVSTYKGEPFYSHSGLVWGMASYIAILPKSDLAVFVSSNQMAPASFALVLDTVNYYLGADTDWIGIAMEFSRSRAAKAKESVASEAAARNTESQPSLDLEAYTGTYRDDWYGDIEISMQDGQLHFQSKRSATLSGPLEHFQFNTFIARWTDRQLMADAYVSFALTPEGQVDRISMKAVSPATDFSYDFHDLDLKRVE